MSLFLIDREMKIIDSYAPQIDNTAPLVTQQDDPNENVQAIGGVKLPELPNASVGGENGSKIRNGYSTGFKSLFTRQQPFSGAVAVPPAITNAVQGEVGATGRADRLYAGVMNQMTSYQASQSFALQYVGAMPDTLAVKS